MGIFQSEMIWFLHISIFILLVGCSRSEETSETVTKTEEKTDTAEALPFTGPVSSDEYERVEEDLFGEFHNDRVSFFITDRPNVVVYGVPPTKVISYYIDDELFQKKFELPSDITHDLITVNGKFRIRGLNSRNDYFIKRLKSRILYGSEIVSLINYYQLRWEKPEEEIIYQVRRDTVETSYTYIERVKGYKQILKRVQSEVSD